MAFEAPPPPPDDSVRSPAPRRLIVRWPRADWPLAAALGAAAVLSAIALHLLRQPPPAAASEERTARLEPAVLPQPIAHPDVASGMTIDAVPSAALQVRISVSEPCWVSAMADGSRVVHRLVEPGDEVDVDATSRITLRVGDAGALSWTVNGRAARRLGLPGEAVTVDITAATVDGLLVHEAASTL